MARLTPASTCAHAQAPYRRRPAARCVVWCLAGHPLLVAYQHPAAVHLAASLQCRPALALRLLLRQICTPLRRGRRALLMRDSQVHQLQRSCAPAARAASRRRCRHRARAAGAMHPTRPQAAYVGRRLAQPVQLAVKGRCALTWPASAPSAGVLSPSLAVVRCACSPGMSSSQRRSGVVAATPGTQAIVNRTDLH